MPDEYRIRTVADFATVPADKISECLADFVQFLKIARQAPQVDQQLQMAFELDQGAIAFDTAEFIWLDDGHCGVTAMKFVDKATGETVVLVDLPPSEPAPAATVRDSAYWIAQKEKAQQIRRQAHEAFERGDRVESSRLYLAALDVEQQPR